MKVLVTGAEGFVGKYLIYHLLEEGFDVVATYRDKKDFPGIKSYEMNILDKEKVTEIITEEKPKYIFHLAAISNVKFSFEYPAITSKVNVEGTRNILEAAKKAGNLPSVLIIGSANEYGIPKKIPLEEDSPLNPDNPYAVSKVEAEKLALEYADKIRVLRTRSFNHIGPGQSEDFVVSSFARQIVKIERGKKPVLYVGNLEAKRDFTDVRDVVKAYSLILDKAENREVFNVCSGKVYSIQEILDKLLKMTDEKIEVKKDKERMRPSDIPILQGSYDKLKEETGWKPEIPIEKSLRDTLDYWRKNL